LLEDYCVVTQSVRVAVDVEVAPVAAAEATAAERLSA
jgi:hypothetical protein